MIPGTQPSPQKLYPGSIDQDSLLVFDMSVNDTTMYGSYSVGASTDVEGISSKQYIDPDPLLTPAVTAVIQQEIDRLAVGILGDFLDAEGEQLNGGVF